MNQNKNETVQLNVTPCPRDAVDSHGDGGILGAVTSQWPLWRELCFGISEV